MKLVLVPGYGREVPPDSRWPKPEGRQEMLTPSPSLSQAVLGAGLWMEGLDHWLEGWVLWYQLGLGGGRAREKCLCT